MDTGSKRNVGVLAVKGRGDGGGTELQARHYASQVHVYESGLNAGTYRPKSGSSR